MQKRRQRQRFPGCPGFACVQQGQAFAVERFQAAPEDGLDERFLGAKVIIDGSEVDSGLGGDGPQRAGGEPALGQEAFGGIQDAGLGIFHIKRMINTNV